MVKRIKDIGRKQPRIKNTGPTQPRVDPKLVAKALGAKIVCADCSPFERARITGHGPQNAADRLKHPRCNNANCGCSCRDDAAAKQYGLKENPFKSLSGLAVGREFLLHVYWSGLDDGGDDGRGHLIQRDKVTADMGLENFPDPPPTAEEMQQVMFAAKMALLKILRQRKRAKR